MEAIISDTFKIIMDSYKKAGKEKELDEFMDGKRTIKILGNEYKVTSHQVYREVTNNKK